MISKIFEKIDLKSNLEIYCNSDNPDSFVFGRIVAINETHLIIALISPIGLYDGLLLKQIDEIISVAAGTAYIAKMEKIIDGDLAKSDYNFDSKNLIEQLLLYAKENNKCVSIELLNSGSNNITGFVDSISDDNVLFRNIDEYGFSDGTTYTLIENITQISCDSQDEILLKKLYKYNIK